jgi:hypothetical protein
MEYSVPLALQDYMTVIFSGIGLLLLAIMINRLDRSLGRMAFIGVALTVLGGTLKASGKLVMALGGPDLAVLHLALFPLIAPGFTLIAWSLWQIRHLMRGEKQARQPWLVPILAIALFAVGVLYIGMNGGPWRVPLILLSTISNFALLLLLIVAAWGRGMWLTGGLFLVTLLVVLAMSQMASLPNPTIAMIWTEQVSQTIAWGLFAIGIRQYSQFVDATYGESLAAQPA